MKFIVKPGGIVIILVIVGGLLYLITSSSHKRTVDNSIVGLGGSPTFTATASASPNTIAPGATGTITVAFKDTGAAASNVVTDIEVHNSAGTKVAQQVYNGQNFTTGGTNTNNWSWTAPTTPGTYTVSLGVFNSTWSTGHYWGSNVATINVGLPSIKFGKPSAINKASANP